MLDRLRQVALLIIGVFVGYVLGSGPFVEWVTDVQNQLSILWIKERIAQGSTGPFLLLLAGFLIGQGLFLLAKSSIRKFGPMLTRRAERLATWDPSLKLATRFGLHQYLQSCTDWAREDPTARTQCLALFKIGGLGALNEKLGTLDTSAMLQQIAGELRVASFPDSATPLRRWLAQHFPKPISPVSFGVPVPRYAARWSGAAFALAFRELDAIQAVAIARDLLNWIRKELDSFDESRLSVRGVVVVGIPGVTSRSLTRAAADAVVTDRSLSELRVLCDPADVRANVISQMTDVKHVATALARHDPNDSPIAIQSKAWQAWFRAWGAGLGCILVALLILRLPGSSASASPSYFPLPDNVTELPFIDQSGARTVHIIRTKLTDQQSSSWRVTDAIISQSDHGPYPLSQVRLSVTNTSNHTFYVSSFDFNAVDTTGRHISFPPERMLRMAQGISGRWLDPGDTWTGWLMTSRPNAPIASIEFTPDRSTRLSLTARPLDIRAAPEP